MNINEFVKLSLGRWRSQRSAHHLAFAHFEEVTSNINIEALSSDDSRVIQLCKSHDIEPHLANSPLK